MKSLQNQEVLLNLALFKRYHFYQLFDPNGQKFSNHSIYKCINIVFIAIVIPFFVFSAMSFLTDEIHKVDYIDLILTIFTYILGIMSLLKIWVFLVKGDKIWDLFWVTRFDFLTSRRCRKNFKILYDYRDGSIKVTNAFLNFSTTVFVTWMIVPLILNTFMMTDIPNHRYHNTFNMIFPVSVSIYNQYFYIFYLIEAVVGIFIWYYSIIIDNFLISLCWAIIAQYEVISTSFEEIGLEPIAENYENVDETAGCDKTYEELKSIIFDQLNVNMSLKSFYSVVWIIVISLIIIDSGAMIAISYSFIVICLSAESYSIFSIVKLFVGFFNVAVEMILYCYLFNVLNIKKESVNFGIYSCDWTKMDLKCKKLLLLAMKINNANKLMMKASPRYIINLQCFSNIMNTVFNVVIFMLKTLNGPKLISK